jgi:hypothetical protein
MDHRFPQKPVNRQAVSKPSILAVILLLLLSVSATVKAARPNIVLMMADDQGWGDVGYNGHPELKTPHLDRMAREGVTFTRF